MTEQEIIAPLYTPASSGAKAWLGGPIPEGPCSAVAGGREGDSAQPQEVPPVMLQIPKS